MSNLTPLETMFVEEFCRFREVPSTDIAALRVDLQKRTPAGFVSTVDVSTVSSRLDWQHRFFKSERIAIVGPNRARCLMMLVFDRQTGRLESIEGDVLSFDWSMVEEPCYWSETDRVIDTNRKG